MARPRREDVPAAVRELIAAWPTADRIDRSVATRSLGAPPDPDAVPYKWLTWKLRYMVRRRESEQATYNALRRTIARMESAGELSCWWFQDTGHCAWVLLRLSVTKPDCSGATLAAAENLATQAKTTETRRDYAT